MAGFTALKVGRCSAYDGVLHDFVAPQSRLSYLEPEFNLHPNCPLTSYDSFKVPGSQPQGAKPPRNHPKENFLPYLGLAIYQWNRRSGFIGVPVNLVKELGIIN